MHALGAFDFEHSPLDIKPPKSPVSSEFCAQVGILISYKSAVTSIIASNLTLTLVNGSTVNTTCGADTKAACTQNDLQYWYVSTWG